MQSTKQLTSTISSKICYCRSNKDTRSPWNVQKQSVGTARPLCRVFTKGESTDLQLILLRGHSRGGEHKRYNVVPKGYSTLQFHQQNLLSRELSHFHPAQSHTLHRKHTKSMVYLYLECQSGACELHATAINVVTKPLARQTVQSVSVHQDDQDLSPSL